jgi:hypothetical protein
MYTDETLVPIMDNAPYVSADGTKYPPNFPKSEIPGLYPVTETEKPVDTNAEVVTGFIINEDLVQAWQTRPRTEEEQTILLKECAYDELAKSDMTALRCVKAGIPFPTAWQEYVAALREIFQTGIGPLPDQPPYPEGT